MSDTTSTDADTDDMSIDTDDLPTLCVGDHVEDREKDNAEGDTPTMLVVELTLERADSVHLDEDRTIADANPDEYATDDVIEVIYPKEGTPKLSDHQRYGFPRGRLRRIARVHSDEDEENTPDTEAT